MVTGSPLEYGITVEQIDHVERTFFSAVSFTAVTYVQSAARSKLEADFTPQM
jgi:hypothetical protein